MIAVFQGRRPDGIVWQPRLHVWYEYNKGQGTLPKRYRGMDLLEIYDDLGATPRSYHYYNDTIRKIEGKSVKVKVEEDRDRITTTYTTPKGEVKEVVRKTVGGVSRIHTEFFIKTLEDFEVLSYILSEQEYEFDKEVYSRMRERIGERAESIVVIPHAPLLALLIDYMGFQKGVIALWRHAKIVEGFLKALEENYMKLLGILMDTPIRIINFGDNIHHDLCSPPIFRKYMIPYYNKVTKMVRDAGKYSTSHWDGWVKKLLPYARETGLDGLECVTPKPQGDVTLEEMHEALQGMVLMDGLPATLFLPWAEEEELKKMTEKLLKTFSPRLIAGISDMLPPNGDIEKVRMVGKIVNNYEPV
jgi:hypothetical protein